MDLLVFVSYFLLVITFPFSIWFCFTVSISIVPPASVHHSSHSPRQIVKEYERAVVFRLGRLRSGGAKGPGLMLVMPCIDSYRCIDLRCCAVL